MKWNLIAFGFENWEKRKQNCFFHETLLFGDKKKLKLKILKSFGLFKQEKKKMGKKMHTISSGGKEKQKQEEASIEITSPVQDKLKT